MNSITTTIQNMKNNNQARYFFSKAHNYQKLHLWLKPLFKARFFKLDKKDENKYLQVLNFLEAVSIQNKENEKPEITKRLLSIGHPQKPKPQNSPFLTTKTP